MARGPFTPDPFSRQTSDGVYQPNHTADGAGRGAGLVADTAKAFSGQLKDMAERAYVREGLADASADVQGGGALALRGGRGVDDQAYNTAIREQMLAQRTSAYALSLDEIERAHPDDVVGFTQAQAAAREAFTPTGDPELDLAFSRSATMTDAASLVRVREGDERRRVTVARGAFVETATAGQTVLGQTIASAGFDEAGGQLVGQALTQYMERLSRFGPRSAFTLGGVDYPADPTRAGAVSPEELGQLAATATVQTRSLWIVNAGERITDPAAKRAYADEVRTRWAAGDAAFMGLDAADVSRITAQLDGEAARAEADVAAAQARAEGETRELLRAFEYGGDVDPQTLRAQAAASGDVGLQAEVDYRLTYGFQVQPGSSGAGGAGGVAGEGFGPWSDFLMDRLEGPGLVGNDNGRGRAQWGITEASHPEAWRDGRVDRAEAARIYRTYWDAIGGDQLSPELAFVAASAAVVGGVGTARDLLAQSGGDPERFLELEGQRFERLARQDPAKYGDDLAGWRNRQGRVRGGLATMRAQRRAQEGYASDPIGRARGSATRQPLASVAEFPALDAPWTGGAQAWGETLKSRDATGRSLSQRDGVPARMLSSEEADFYRAAIEEDAARLPVVVAAAATALGPDGARRFLGEIGRSGMAAPDLHLASLSIDPANRGTVTLVIEGRQLRGDGAKAPSFGDQESLDEAMAPYARALSASPEISPAIRSLAEDMAIADAARGRLRPASVYLNTALGATYRNNATYGGLTTVNGRETVLPTWLRSDSLDDALGIAAEQWTAGNWGPVYSNGEAIPKWRLDDYQLRALPDGSYQLIDPRSGAAAARRDGGAFIFEIEHPYMRELLTRRLPGAVLEGR